MSSSVLRAPRGVSPVSPDRAAQLADARPACSLGVLAYKGLRAQVLGQYRQLALELAGPDLTIVAVDPDGEIEHASLRSLLPRAPSRHSPEFDT